MHTSNSGFLSAALSWWMCGGVKPNRHDESQKKVSELITCVRRRKWGENECICRMSFQHPISKMLSLHIFHVRTAASQCYYSVRLDLLVYAKRFHPAVLMRSTTPVTSRPVCICLANAPQTRLFRSADTAGSKFVHQLRHILLFALIFACTFALWWE